MFKTNSTDPDYEKLEKISELNQTDSVKYLVNSILGETKKADQGMTHH